MSLRFCGGGGDSLAGLKEGLNRLVLPPSADPILEARVSLSSSSSSRVYVCAYVNQSTLSVVFSFLSPCTCPALSASLAPTYYVYSASAAAHTVAQYTLTSTATCSLTHTHTHTLSFSLSLSLFLFLSCLGC